MDLISVIIPSYNRFKYLLNLLESIKNQTYTNIEIIVINDGSIEKEYYTYDWEDNNIIIIHLEENTSKQFGHGCVGYVRNKGLEIAKGKYIAYADDDDIWFSANKLDIQISALKDSTHKMCCSDGFIGRGIYKDSHKYRKYNEEECIKQITLKHQKKGSTMMDNGFPDIFTFDFLNIHNSIITSSIIIEKNILDKIGGMPYKRRGQDYLCWLQCLKHTDCIYLKDNLIYYDKNHGYGSNH